jgi:hypothetical protein
VPARWTQYVFYLRYTWSLDFCKFTQIPQRPCVYCDDEEHDANSHDPEGYEDALLPEYRLLRHGGVVVDAIVVVQCKVSMCEVFAQSTFIYKDQADER